MAVAKSDPLLEAPSSERQPARCIVDVLDEGNEITERDLEAAYYRVCSGIYSGGDVRSFLVALRRRLKKDGCIKLKP